MEGFDELLKPIENLHPLTGAEKVIENAIATGDISKIEKAKNELRQDLITCIRQGTCGRDIGMAIGIGAIATVGILGEGDWVFNPEDDSFHNKDNPDQVIPANVADEMVKND